MKADNARPNSIMKKSFRPRFQKYKTKPANSGKTSRKKSKNSEPHSKITKTTIFQLKNIVKC